LTLDNLSVFNAFKLPSMMIDNEPHWHDLAACRGVHDEDPSIFFPKKGDKTRRAREMYCSRCIVSIECGEFADGKEALYPDTGFSPSLQKHGIWNGESWKDRRNRCKNEIAQEMRDEAKTGYKKPKFASKASRYTTHCSKGHEYVEGTVRIDINYKNGKKYRRCLICLDIVNKAVNERKAKKKADEEIRIAGLVDRVVELEKQLRSTL